MLKKLSFKLAFCFAFALLFLLSGKSSNAMAEETKVVTVTVPQSVTVPDTVINNVMQSISNSTYNYDDGTFTGVLPFAGTSGWSQTLYAQYPDVTLYTYSFHIIYSGTVVRYVQPVTKYVTVNVPYTITVPDYVIQNILQSISTSTYNYDDGSFKGTLNCTGISGLTSTFNGSYPGYNLYTYSFNVSYAGYVSNY